MINKPWSTSDIPDLEGKRVIITGGNSGLGFETAKALAYKGANIVLACRSIIRGEEAAAKIRKENPNIRINVFELDLADLESVQKFSDAFKKQYSALDILINNAGIMMVPYALTKNGFESQFGVNHLGHFALTGLLLEHIRNTPGSRVINVSSLAHRYAAKDFSNSLFKGGKGYNRIKAYGRSKLANLLFTYELQRYFESHKINSMALAAHPGSSDTNLPRYIDKKFLFKLMKPLLKVFGQSAAMGALPQIRAAVDPNAKGGEFYGPAGMRELTGPPVKVRSNEDSFNTEFAKRLWVASEELTGVEFPK